MANEIREKFSATNNLTITLFSLASSTARVGRASASVDNSSTRYLKIILFLQIDLGTSSTVDKSVQVYFLRRDTAGSPMGTDGWDGTDQGFTVLNATLIGSLLSKTAGEQLRGEFVIYDPGPTWGIAIVHDTGVALDSTESNHKKTWIGVLPEVQ